MSKPDGIELALLAALRYEEATLKSVDTKQFCGIDKDELKIVLKYMKNRMDEIKART